VTYVSRQAEVVQPGGSMSKTKLACALTALALMAAPGVALAHGSHGHHHKRHAKKHHAHKAKIRQIVGAPASSTTPSTTTPAPAVTAKVTSFDKGELTITLSNGKAYTADVTAKTKIECEPAAVPTARTASDDDDDGDDDGEHGQREHGDGDHNDDGHPDNGQVKCDTSALTAGTQVTEAELKIAMSGATWKSLELVK
jgi:hypothetical protein